MFRVIYAIAAILVILLTPSASPATTTRNDYFLNIGNVQQITCMSLPAGVTLGDDPEKWTDDQIDQIQFQTGTGTIIAHNRVLTAAHVVHGAATCFFGKALVQISFEDRALDVAVLDVPLGETAFSPISCDGFDSLADEPFFAIGYAWGKDFAIQKQQFTGQYIAAALTDTTETMQDEHLGLFAGETYPGMSGGPIVGQDGRIYGVVIGGDQREVSLYRDLRDTPLCAAMQPAPASAADEKKTDSVESLIDLLRKPLK